MSSNVTTAWLEVLSPTGQIQTRIRVDRSPFVIGRSPVADYYVEDPYLAAEHLEFSVNEQGRWCAMALPSMNGVHLQGQLIDSLVVSDNQTFRLGQQRLRLRTAQAVITPEILMPAGLQLAEDSAPPTGEFTNQEQRLQSLNQGIQHPAVPSTDRVLAAPAETMKVRSAAEPVDTDVSRLAGIRRWATWRNIALVGIIFAIVELIGTYAFTTGEYKVLGFAGPVLMFVGIAVAWSFVWSLLSRVLAGALRFKEHLFIASATILTTSLLNEVITFVGYGLALPNVSRADSLMRYVFMVLAIYFHLQLVTQVKRRVLALGLASFFVGALAIFYLGSKEQLVRSFGMAYNDTAIAPFKQLKPAQSTNDVLGGLVGLKKDLDRARLEKPGDEDLSSLFED
jgi:pSer/pThr/pTyr-binding forkhead associated (FHA) protein